MSAKSIQRELARSLNQAIDRALLEPTESKVAALRRMAGRPPPQELAERVRQRAIRLGRRGVRIPERRDALIAALYAAAAPHGWFVAWCDGSSSRAPPGRAGLGGFIIDSRGEPASQIARFAPGLDSFAAEIGALVAVLETGLALGAREMRAHTDCPALAQLWHERREDHRLDAVRTLARRYRRFELRAVPRKHNAPANRLAREAMIAEKSLLP
jgi:ribonuclease HI